MDFFKPVKMFLSSTSPSAEAEKKESTAEETDLESKVEWDDVEAPKNEAPAAVAGVTEPEKEKSNEVVGSETIPVQEQELKPAAAPAVVDTPVTQQPEEKSSEVVAGGETVPVQELKPAAVSTQGTPPTPEEHREILAQVFAQASLQQKGRMQSTEQDHSKDTVGTTPVSQKQGSPMQTEQEQPKETIKEAPKQQEGRNPMHEPNVGLRHNLMVATQQEDPGGQKQVHQLAQPRQGDIAQQQDETMASSTEEQQVEAEHASFINLVDSPRILAKPRLVQIMALTLEECENHPTVQQHGIRAAKYGEGQWVCRLLNKDISGVFNTKVEALRHGIRCVAQYLHCILTDISCDLTSFFQLCFARHETRA